MIVLEYYLELPARTTLIKIKSLQRKLQAFCLDVPCERIRPATASELTLKAPSWGEPCKQALGFCVSFLRIPVFNFFLYKFPTIHKGKVVPWFFRGRWEIPNTSPISTTRAIKAVVMLLDKAQELGIYVAVQDDTGFWKARKDLFVNVKLLNSKPDIRDLQCPILYLDQE